MSLNKEVEDLLNSIDDKFLKNYYFKGQRTYIKAVITGHVIEIYEYEKQPVLPADTDRSKDKLEDENIDIYDNVESNRKNNMQKARNNLRRLITANFDEGSKFITLTFAKNITDLDYANYEFMKFIQRLRYRYKAFKYAAVIEFQKRGAVHYHMISDLPYIDNATLNKVWGNGFVKINNIDHVDNVGAYMIKYMTKDISDKRLRGRKSYLTSKNLERPIILKGDEVERIKDIYGLNNKNTVFANSYENEHLGLSVYKEYNLKRL